MKLERKRVKGKNKQLVARLQPWVVTSADISSQIDEAIENHYKTVTFRSDFVHTIHDTMKTALEDQVGAQ